MSRFCPHDWHQTTEADLQHMGLGGEDYEYAVWESSRSLAPKIYLTEAQKKQKVITDKAYALAVERRLVPYTEETFLALMDEVEAMLTARQIDPASFLKGAE
jgi:hypothetical protein